MTDYSELVSGLRELAKSCGFEHGTETGQLCWQAADALEEAGRREAELSRQVYVPGLWRCAKCEFQLVQANLHAATGTVSARDKPGDKCPNCNASLWRVTERQAGNDMVDRCEQQVARATAAEAEAARLRTALEAHHRWHLDQGIVWAPTNEANDSDFVSWDAADAYSESSLCDQTVAALAKADPESHDWFRCKPEWPVSCRKCGIVRRADGRNSPCKGLVKLALRAPFPSPRTSHEAQRGAEPASRFSPCDEE